MRRIKAIAKELGYLRTEASLAQPEISWIFPALVKDSLTHAMERSALKQKPEAITVGADHSFPMRKDMKIPENKFLLVRAQFHKHSKGALIGLRRFQRQRRQKKKYGQKQMRK